MVARSHQLTVLASHSLERMLWLAFAEEDRRCISALFSERIALQHAPDVRGILDEYASRLACGGSKAVFQGGILCSPAIQLVKSLA